MDEMMLSFDDAARTLGVGAEELKQMVADNTIRAFHVGGQLQFKRVDVEQLKNRLDTAPAIVLSDTGLGAVLDEPGDFDLDAGLIEEEPAGAVESAAAMPLEPEISLGGDGFDLGDDALASEETVLSVDGLLESDDVLSPDDTVAGGFGGGDDTVLDSGLLDDDDLSLSLDETEGDALLDGGEIRSGPRRVRAKVQETNPTMTALLVVTSVCLILPGAILVNLSGGDHGVFPAWIKENLTFMSGLIDGIMGLF